MTFASKDFTDKVRRKRCDDVVDDLAYISKKHGLSGSDALSVIMIAEIRMLSENIEKLQNSINGTT